MAGPVRWAGLADTLLRDPLPVGVLNTSFPAGTSCVSRKHGNFSSDWCIDVCLNDRLSQAVYDECLRSCDCSYWDRETIDYVIGTMGALSLLACLAIFVLDVRGHESTRCPSQKLCLRWANVCNFFYSAYYLLYAVGDAQSPMRDWKSGQCDNAWGGLIGVTSCNKQGGQPLCFLNCCVFAVPWLELFGYGSLLWNMMWSVDLARFALLPLAPEKVFGLPIMALYHALTWLLTLAIAFEWDFGRLSTATCRRARIVMVPCVLRRANIQEALPWVHLIGFACVAVSAGLSAQRYVATTWSYSRNPQREALNRSVRRYLRSQWFHMLSLILIWIIIILDNTRPCTEDWLAYLASAGFAGLGFCLSADRLVNAAKDAYRSRQHLLPQTSVEGEQVACALEAALTHATASTTDPPSTVLSVQDGASTADTPGDTRSYISTIAGGHLSPTARPVPRRRCSSPENYRLVDLDELLEHLLEYLGEERQQASLHRRVLPQDHSEQVAFHRSTASLDDHPLFQADWTVSPRCGADSAFTVVAPRTFQYLKRLWGVDPVRLHEELATADPSTIRGAAKSGGVLLTAASGATFVLKTVSEPEMRQLRSMLPAYRRHMEEHPDSLLCHVYGAFTFRNVLGGRLHTILMDCLTSSHEDRLCTGSCASIRNDEAEAPPQPPPRRENSAGSQLAKRRQSSTSSLGTLGTLGTSNTGFGFVDGLLLFDMKSEFQDGGFVQRFPGGLAMHSASDGCCTDVAKGWRAALDADYAFLSGLGIVDYSLLLVVWGSPLPSEKEGAREGCPGRTRGHSHHGSAGFFQISDTAEDETCGGLYSARMGIIDFLVPFDKRKQAESALKRKLLHPRHSSERVTIMDPAAYAERQRAFVQGKVFPPRPDAADAA